MKMLPGRLRKVRKISSDLGFIQASGNVGATGKCPPAFSLHTLEVQLLRKANIAQVLSLHGKERRECYLIIY